MTSPTTTSKTVIRRGLIGAGLGVGVLLVIGVMTGPATPATPAAAATPAVSTPDVTVVNPMAAWNNDGGHDRMAAIVGDLNTMADTGSKADVTGMNSACTALRTDVEAAQAYSPIPDQEAQGDWAIALAQTARAATDCVDGTATMDVSLLTRSASELRVATAALDRVGGRLRTLG